MPLRIILFSILSLFFYQTTYSQDNVKENRHEIYNYICVADALLIDCQYNESLETSNKALDLAFKYKQYDYVAMLYNTIAGCHEELLNTKKALDYYKKALLYAQRSSNDTIKDWVHNNIGNVYNFDLKDYKKGIFHYKKSLDYAEKRRDTAEIIFTKTNLAWAYFNEKKYDEGFPYLEFASKNLPRYPDKESDVIVSTLYGMYHSHKKDYQTATPFFKKAIQIGEKYKQKKALADAYKEYSHYLFQKGDFKAAYLNKDNYQRLVDEINTSEKVKNAQIAGIQLELDESRREINKIEIEKFAQEQNLKNSRIMVFLFLGVMMGLLLFLYTLYRNNNLKKELNEQLRDSNIELQKAKDKAEESSILKSQFISTVSHELRTPLYGVIGITDLILDEHEELQKSPHINSLKFSAKYLLSLVNDLLQINKIEDKKIILEESLLDINDEIKKVVDSLQFLAINNNNKVEVKLDDAIPKDLIGDKLRLSQIFVNLISNSLKFTKNGKIEVISVLEKTVKNLNYLRFEVRDNGCGIACENQEKVFEKFVQIDRKEDDYQGTGLGLSIVKRLLEFMGSEIKLKSEVNVGTAISFTIMLEAVPAKEDSIMEVKLVDEADTKNYKILAVEDNKINQMVTRKILEKNNFACVIAEDGYFALEILENENFDLILMDINMPKINGFETTRRIRKKGITTPIIALTAFDKNEITEEALASGMDDILIKPFDPALLFKIINDQIEKSK